jgi:hypothetical protein
MVEDEDGDVVESGTDNIGVIGIDHPLFIGGIEDI